MSSATTTVINNLSWFLLLLPLSNGNLLEAKHPFLFRMGSIGVLHLSKEHTFLSKLEKELSHVDVPFENLKDELAGVLLQLPAAKEAAPTNIQEPTKEMALEEEPVDDIELSRLIKSL